MSLLDKLKPASRPFGGAYAGYLTVGTEPFCWTCLMGMGSAHSAHPTEAEAEACAAKLLAQFKTQEGGREWFEFLAKAFEQGKPLT